MNSRSDRESQFGEAKRIEIGGKTEQYTIRLNIVNLAKDIIAGCYRFLDENKVDDIRLFIMIDWDNKGNIIFTPNK